MDINKKTFTNEKNNHRYCFYTISNFSNNIHQPFTFKIMAKIIEILDSENIQSTFNNWFNECEKFRKWHWKMGAHEVDDLEMENAYLKIKPKKEYVDVISKILNYD